MPLISIVMCSMLADPGAAAALTPLPIGSAADRMADQAEIVSAARMPIDLTPRAEAPAMLSLGGFGDADDSAAPAGEAAGASRDFGRDGSRYWMIRGAVGTDDDSDTMALFGAGLQYFIADDVSLNFELNAAGFNQDGEDPFGVNLGLILRWHFYVSDDRSFSIYGEGGAGLLVTTEDIPDGASEFNFTPQLGGGVSFDAFENARMDVGLRWFHVSNANLYEFNPGRDHAIIYAELCFPF